MNEGPKAGFRVVASKADSVFRGVATLVELMTWDVGSATAKMTGVSVHRPYKNSKGAHLGQ